MLPLQAKVLNMLPLGGINPNCQGLNLWLKPKQWKSRRAERVGAIFSSLHCGLSTIGQAQPKESPTNSVVFGGRVVLTAGEAEISDGGTEGGGHPESGQSQFFRKSSKNKKCAASLWFVHFVIRWV